MNVIILKDKIPSLCIHELCFLAELQRDVNNTEREFAAQKVVDTTSQTLKKLCTEGGL